VPNNRMLEVVAEEARLLGFRPTGIGRWLMAGEVPMVMLLNGKEVFLTLATYKSDADKSLGYLVKRPLGADFRLRLRKRLALLSKKALRTARAQKRIEKAIRKTTALPQPKSVVADREPSYGNMRSYNPLCWCGSCHRMIRENLMHNDKICIDCFAEKEKTCGSI